MKRIFLTFLAVAVLLASCSQKEDAGAVEGQVTCWEDLRGHSVAVMLGSIQDVLLTEKYPEIELMRINDVAEEILAVQKQVVEYGTNDIAIFAGTDLKEKHIKIDFVGSEVQSTSVAVRKDDAALCNEFNAFLTKLKDDGTLDEMNERWTVAPVDPNGMPADIELPKNSDKKLVIGVTATNFPFCFVNNSQITGFEIEMMNRFSAYSGYELEFQDYNFASMIAALVSGKIDMIVAFMTATEERAKQVLFSDSYFPTSTCCFSFDPSTVSEDNPGFWAKLKNSFTNNLIVDKRWKLLLDGLWETLVIAFFALILGTLLGALICWMSLSRNKGLRGFAKAYVSIVQGVPILVFLMFMFYVVFASSRVAATWVAIFAFALNFAAFVSGMFASGINSVDKGQNEAGRALGFNKLQTFVQIIAPQALQRIIPVFKGEAISLVKNTSIVGYIAIMDLTKVSDIIRSRTFDAFFPLIIISVIYFILAYLIGKGLDLLAKKTSPKSKQI